MCENIKPLHLLTHERKKSLFELRSKEPKKTVHATKIEEESLWFCDLIAILLASQCK